jgi:uncharacterized membrane protein YkoI
MLVPQPRKWGREELSMNARPKYIVAGAAAAALAIVGGVAASGMGGDDEPLTGDTLARASEAALAHTGGGEVIETETEDDGNVAYSVEVRLADGTVTEVELDEAFQVVGTEPDDDDADDGPLTGETLEQASAAALAHTGGGTVVDSEAETGGNIAYSVEVRLDDGSEVEVDLDESFQVVGSHPDDDDDDDDDDGDDEGDDDD